MSLEYSEQPVKFMVDDRSLHGVLSIPSGSQETGVLIVVGGPQFRVGSHRQFVLLARNLAQNNIYAMRFDYTGMGYSEGVPSKFYEIDTDIEAAISFMLSENPALKNIFVWGLCDAAAAAAFYAHTDKRVNGVILLNPWVRSEAGHSKVLLSSYYKDRWFNIEVWKELLKSPRKIIAAVGSLFGIIFTLLSSKKKAQANNNSNYISIDERLQDLASAMFKGLNWFQGKICLVLSENDLTAKEFEEALEQHNWLLQAQHKTEVHRVNDANHTFSSMAWRAEVEQVSLDFIKRNS